MALISRSTSFMASPRPLRERAWSQHRAVERAWVGPIAPLRQKRSPPVARDASRDCQTMRLSLRASWLDLGWWRTRARAIPVPAVLLRKKPAPSHEAVPEFIRAFRSNALRPRSMRMKLLLRKPVTLPAPRAIRPTPMTLEEITPGLAISADRHRGWRDWRRCNGGLD